MFDLVSTIASRDAIVAVPASLGTNTAVARASAASIAFTHSRYRCRGADDVAEMRLRFLCTGRY